MAIIRGYTETLILKKQGNINTKEWDNYIQLILNKILQVERMVMDLFELSKMESVEFKANKEPFVLSEIVQEMVNNFQVKATDKKINLKCTKCQYHVWINADISLMERVIQNLVDNAVKNTPENDSIKVWLEVENNNLIFKIENSGSPLSPDMLAWINSPETEMVQYVERPAKKGLGLVIVKRILRLHNTSLKAETLNDQNLFSFSLPEYNH